jgi:hypothetical protein
MSKVKRPSQIQIWLVAIVMIAISPLILLALVLYLVAGILLHIAAWCFWCARGHDVLLVYSNSPVWQAYFEDELIPRLGRRAIVLNWSQRSSWGRSLAVAAFRFFGGNRDFNPMAVVFRPFRIARSFRYYKPFREFKHGKPEAVNQLTDRLLAMLDGHGVHKRRRRCSYIN